MYTNVGSTGMEHGNESSDIHATYRQIRNNVGHVGNARLLQFKIATSRSLGDFFSVLKVHNSKSARHIVEKPITFLLKKCRGVFISLETLGRSATFYFFSTDASKNFWVGGFLQGSVG